jgi:hypothetical protein
MDEISRNWWYRARVDLYSDMGAMKKVHYTWLPHLRIDLLEEVRFRGRFTPRGRANLLCKRFEIFTCGGSKGRNLPQLLYT